MTFLAAAVLVVLDQLAKVWAVQNLVLGTLGITVIPGALYLSYVQNTGAAFGLLRGVDLTFGPLHVDGTFLLGLLSLAVSLWLIVHLVRHARSHGAWMRVALTLILAGAVGNMIDRFRLGYVIDYVNVHVGWFNFPVFNLADACISVGAVLLMGLTLLQPSSPSPSATTAGPAPAGTSERARDDQASD